MPNLKTGSLQNFEKNLIVPLSILLIDTSDLQMFLLGVMIKNFLEFGGIFESPKISHDEFPFLKTDGRNDILTLCPVFLRDIELVI